MGEGAGLIPVPAAAGVAPAHVLVGLPGAGVREMFFARGGDRAVPGGGHPGLIGQLEIEREVVAGAGRAVFAGGGVVGGTKARGTGAGGEGAAAGVAPRGLAAGPGGGPAVDHPDALAVDRCQRAVRVGELVGDIFALGAGHRIRFAVGAAVGLAAGAVEGPVAIAAGLAAAGRPIPIALGAQGRGTGVVVVERLVAGLVDGAAVAVGRDVGTVGRKGAVAVAVVVPGAEARVDPHPGGSGVGGGVGVTHVVFGELGEIAGHGA